jgi:hypothetical protein
MCECGVLRFYYTFLPMVSLGKENPETQPLTVIRIKQSSCESGASWFNATPPSLRSGASFGLSRSGYLDMPLLRYPMTTLERPLCGKSSVNSRKFDIGRLRRSCALSACDAMAAVEQSWRRLGRSSFKLGRNHTRRNETREECVRVDV